MAEEKKLSPQDELAQLQAEETRLRVELMRDEVHAKRMIKEMRVHQQKIHQQDEKARLDRIQRSQAQCNHRKGGLGVNDFTAGNGSGAVYAVATNTYPWGETVVMCLRCEKEWHPPGCKCNPKRPNTAEEYAEARRFPTDNTPSEAVTFNIPAAV
jgi:hypothetical protein